MCFLKSYNQHLFFVVCSVKSHCSFGRKDSESWLYVSRLTLMRWKLTLQLAPALEGMKRSPCLLGEDRGELVGVRARTAPTAFYTRWERRKHFLTGAKQHRPLIVMGTLCNKAGRSLRWQMGHLSEVLTTGGIIHKTQSFGRGGLVFTQHS